MGDPRETVAQVPAELSAAEAAPAAPVKDAPEIEEASAPHGVGVMAVPPWREGLVARVLPDMYRDIVEIVADAPGLPVGWSLFLVVPGCGSAALVGERW